jgi:hypothetical protein
MSARVDRIPQSHWAPTARARSETRAARRTQQEQVSLPISNGHAWGSPSSRQMVDRDGITLRDSVGKLRWQPLATFAKKNVRDSWSAQVAQAVHEAYPKARRDVIPGTAA